MYALKGDQVVTQYSLKQYKDRRNLKLSGEPSGGKRSRKHALIFVVQKHQSKHVHYDFRLEIEGVLVSWAVPKGPSLNTRYKRLALATENHPMDYATFEGEIHEGNYGAGFVTVWDIGTYKNIKTINGKKISMKECLKKGTLEIELYGKKLRGRFALIRTQTAQKNSWLLIKMKDSYADARKDIVLDMPESVLSSAATKKETEHEDMIVGKHVVRITHPNKIVGKKPRVTKKDLVRYYVHIAPIMLTYLKDRPLTMQRFVEGIDSEGFYQKEASEYFPAYIKRVTVKKEGGLVHHVMVNNAESLVYLANQLVICFHVWLSKKSSLYKPDRIIFDFDPATNNFTLVQAAALRLKKIIERLGLVPYVMTTGSRGLHVVIPIKPKAVFDDVRLFAHDIACYMVKQDPKTLTLEMRKEKRKGKIFIDYLRNGFAATGIAPYSARARPGFPVATPITWAEVAQKGLRSDKWTIVTIRDRLNVKGDIWQDMRMQARPLGVARKKLDALIRRDKGEE